MSKKVEIRKIVSTDLLPLVYNYLNSIGLESVAKKLEKKSGLDMEESESPFAEKKLQKIAKFYVTNHKQMIQKFIVKKQESESESEEEEVVSKKKSKKEDKLNKKRKASKQQDSSDEEEEKNDSGNETPIVKKSKKNAKKQESEDEEEEQIVKQESIPELEEEQLEPGQRKYFQKCDDRKLQYLKPQFADFTHEAKKKFGSVGDAFGDIGNEQLKDVRGKHFRKGKDKLKNRNFCGGDAGINIHQINSIPL